MMAKIKNLFKNRAFNVFLILCIAVLVAYVTVKDNFNEVMKTISNLNIFYVILLVLFAYLVQVIMAWVLKILTNIRRPNYSFFNALTNATIASLFHGITPSASGGQIIQAYVYRKQGIKIETSLSILLIDFILYQAALVFVSVIFLIIKFEYFVTNYNSLIFLLILGFTINSALVVGLFSMSSSKKVYTFISVKVLNLLHKIKIVKNKEETLDKLNKSLNEFSEAWKDILDHKSIMIKVFLLNILRLLIYYSIPILIMMSLGFKMSIAMGFQVMILTGFTYIMNAMIPIPGASGTSEAVFITLMKPYLGYVGAVSTSLVWRFVTYYSILLIGTLFFVQFNRYHDKGVN